MLLRKIICVYNAISKYDSDRDRKYFLESNFLLNTNIKTVKCRINPQFKKIEKRKGIQVLKTGSARKIFGKIKTHISFTFTDSIYQVQLL